MVSELGKVTPSPSVALLRPRLSPPASSHPKLLDHWLFTTQYKKTDQVTGYVFHPN